MVSLKEYVMSFCVACRQDVLDRVLFFGGEVEKRKTLGKIFDLDRLIVFRKGAQGMYHQHTEQAEEAPHVFRFLIVCPEKVHSRHFDQDLPAMAPKRGLNGAMKDPSRGSNETGAWEKHTKGFGAKMLAKMGWAAVGLSTLL